MRKNLPIYENVKALGRTMVKNDKLWMCYSATGAAFHFEGKMLNIVLCGDDRAADDGMGGNHARVRVLIDGEYAAEKMVDQKEIRLEVIRSESKKACLVEVVKVSESAMSTVALSSIETDDEAKIRPAENKKHIIEFAGDSITCGYGVDDEVAEHNFKTDTEDATKAYAYLTAKKLNADYSLVSLSGYGIISGFSGDGERRPDQLLPTYYEKMGFCYGSMNGVYPQDVQWNFKQIVPDVVVINLGTNDQSFTRGKEELCEEYCAEYQRFIRNIRKNNPNAYILCMLGVMGEALCPMAQKAVDQYRAETGDNRISFHAFTEQLPEDGRAADWHPSQLTHRKVAEKLSAIIQEIMKW